MKRLRSVATAFSALCLLPSPGGADVTLLETSDIETAGAIRCFRSLELAVSPPPQPGDPPIGYPEHWVAVPGKLGAQEGAFLFNDQKPEWSAFYSDEYLRPTPHGYFMDFWGDVSHIEDAAGKAKQVYDAKARGHLANFLANRIAKIHSRFTGGKRSSVQPAAPAGLVKKTESFDPKQIWREILESGKKTLSRDERALLERVEAWREKEARWNALRDASAPYPAGEPSDDEKESHGSLLDRAEAEGVKRLSAAKWKAWEAFKTPHALGQIELKADPMEAATDPSAGARDLMAEIDRHFDAFKKMGDEERMTITRAGLVQALEACKQVRGDDRIRELADKYLKGLRGSSDGPAPRKQAPRAGGAR